MKTDLTQATATELLALYRKDKASPVDVVKAVLSRAQDVNPRINALCLVDQDNAMNL